MSFSVSATAPATVANQPAFDVGGFSVNVLEVVSGEVEDWESLRDEVTIFVDTDKRDSQIVINNVVLEEGVDNLPIDILENTAGRVVKLYIDYLEGRGIDFDYNLNLTIKKGLSIRGTGLGSSGATVAASYKAFEGVLEKLEIKGRLFENDLIDLFIEADFGVPDNAIPAYFGGLVIINLNQKPITIDRIQKNLDFGYFVIATPKGFGIKTQDARKVLIGKESSEDNQKLIQKQIEAIQTGDPKLYGQLMEKTHQWFVEPRSRLYPKKGLVFDKVKEVAKQKGAYGVTISGAGPSMIAIVIDIETGREVAKAMYKTFKDFGFDSVSRIVDFDSDGAKFG